MSYYANKTKNTKLSCAQKKYGGEKIETAFFFPSFAHNDDFCPPFVCSGIFHYYQIILELLAYRVDRL